MTCTLPCILMGEKLALHLQPGRRLGPVLMDLTTGAVTQVTDTPNRRLPELVSGRAVAGYESYISTGMEATWRFSFRPLDEAQPPIRLTEDPAADHSPVWSPQRAQAGLHLHPQRRFGGMAGRSGPDRRPLHQP